MAYGRNTPSSEPIFRFLFHRELVLSRLTEFTAPSAGDTGSQVKPKTDLPAQWGLPIATRVTPSSQWPRFTSTKVLSARKVPMISWATPPRIT